MFYTIVGLSSEDFKNLREELGYSRSEFAKTFCISLMAIRCVELGFGSDNDAQNYANALALAGIVPNHKTISLEEFFSADVLW